jgi:hypothetical protein
VKYDSEAVMEDLMDVYVWECVESVWTKRACLAESGLRTDMDSFQDSFCIKDKVVHEY